MKIGWRSERGQYLVQFVILLPLLLGFMGLVIDLGNAYAHQRMAQNAADAAAAAGGMVLYSQGAAAAETQARYYAGLHGYSGKQVEITWPPQCIRVTVTEAVRPIFVSMVWNGTFTVRGRAGACYRFTEVGASVVVLDPNACSALNVSGTSRITVNRGNITVNSACNPSISVSGGALIRTETPIVYVGGVVGASAITPPPVRGSPLPDPLAYLPVPEACNLCASSPTTQSCTKTSCAPGCYKNGLSLSGGTLTMAPGIYCIAGSGMKITGGTNLSGSGVVLYLMTGGVDISGTGVLNLTPPASGVYQGVLIFQARNNISSSKISGQAALSGIHGVIYMPVGALELAGGATIDANFAVSTLKVSGGGDMVIQGYTGAGANWSTVTDALME